MTSARRQSTDRPPRRRTTGPWALFVAVIAIVGLVAALPWITTMIVVVLWGLGGSGSNK